MKRIITMITAAALGLMAWTSHAAVATVTVDGGTPMDLDWWDMLNSFTRDATSKVEVKLTEEVSLTSMFSWDNSSAEFVLDLNGQKMSYSSGDVIVVKSGATLTITDSSENETGRICCSDNTSYAVQGKSDSTVNIEGGIFDGNVKLDNKGITHGCRLKK